MTTIAVGPVVAVTGDPRVVLETSQALADLATRVAGVQARLDDLRCSVLWESPAGWRFDTAMRALPDVLDLIQARYRAAAEALRQWSVDLRGAVHDSRRAVEAHERARADLDRIERELQSAALDPTGGAYEQLRLRHAVATRQAIEAQEECSRAWLRLHAAAEVCAVTVRAAAADSMVDSSAYTVVRGVRSVTAGLTAALGAAALVPSPVQAFAAAGTGVVASATVGADLLLLLGFGDGSWSEVASSTFWLVAGKGASGLTRAAGVGAVRTGSGTWTGQRLSTGTRLQAGREQILRDLREQRAALRTPVVRSTPEVGSAQRAGSALPGHRRTLQLIEDRLEAKVLGINERWQMALAGGRNAVVLQGGADALRIAHRARSVHRGAVTAGEQTQRTRDRYEEWQQERATARR